MLLAGLVLVVAPWGWAGVVLWTVAAALGFASAAFFAVCAITTRCARASAQTAKKAAEAKPSAAATVQSTTPAQPHGATTRTSPARSITVRSRAVKRDWDEWEGMN